MKMKWKDATPLYRAVTVISVAVSLSVVVLALLVMFDVWQSAINICVPLMGATMLCQAYMQWNTSRKVAYFSIGSAAFVFICAVIVFFVN